MLSSSYNPAGSCSAESPPMKFVTAPGYSMKPSTPRSFYASTSTPPSGLVRQGLWYSAVQFPNLGEIITAGPFWERGRMTRGEMEKFRANNSRMVRKDAKTDWKLKKHMRVSLHMKLGSYCRVTAIRQLTRIRHQRWCSHRRSCSLAWTTHNCVHRPCELGLESQARRALPAFVVGGSSGLNIGRVQGKTAVRTHLWLLTITAAESALRAS